MYLRQSHNSAGRTSAGVSGRQRIRVIGASQVIFASMHDNASSDNTAITG